MSVSVFTILQKKWNLNYSNKINLIVDFKIALLFIVSHVFNLNTITKKKIELLKCLTVTLILLLKL